MVNVNTDLGGVRSGHLGVGLTAAKYVSVSKTVYARSVHPRQAASVGTTQYEKVRLRDDYKKGKRLFREVKDIEKAITKQIFQAIDKLYLKSLRNRSTNAIRLNVAQILTYLFDR